MKLSYSKNMTEKHIHQSTLATTMEKCTLVFPLLIPKPGT